MDNNIIIDIIMCEYTRNVGRMKCAAATYIIIILYIYTPIVIETHYILYYDVIILCVRVLDTTKKTAELVRRVKTKRANSHIYLYNISLYYIFIIRLYTFIIHSTKTRLTRTDYKNNTIKAVSVFPISKTAG